MDHPRSRGRGWLLGAIGLIAYLLALIATLPARFVDAFGSNWTTSGTIWRGEAVLDGAWQARWRFAPLRSIAALTFAADVEITGVGTDLVGTVSVWRGHRRFETLAGRADGGLLSALAPAFPLTCETGLQVDLSNVLIAASDVRASGNVRAENPSCTASGSTMQILFPTLSIRATDTGDATRVEVAPAGPIRRVWLQGGIAGGRVRLAPTAEGLRAQPVLRVAAMDAAL